MYLAGSFHCFWGPVWPPTSAQCVRPEAWSVVAPCGCLTSSGFCWTAPYRACWNIHALSAKKHVWCCHAMAVPTLQDGLLMPKTGCPDGLGSKKVMGRVWSKTEVWSTSSNTSIIHERYMSITFIIHSWYILDTLAIHRQYIVYVLSMHKNYIVNTSQIHW